MSKHALNWIGLAASYLFVSLVIALCTLLLRGGLISASSSRKIIHIGVSNWWLLAMAMFDSPLFAAIGPASFILINSLALRFNLLPAMAPSAGRRDWGTIWFPISLLLLVILCWSRIMPFWIGGLAVLIMGWGDGLAALVGESLAVRSPRIPGTRKTLAGSGAMFAASFAVAFAFDFLANPCSPSPAAAAGHAALIASVASIVELFTPFRLDNLTVPLATAFFSWALFP